MNLLCRTLSVLSFTLLFCLPVWADNPLVTHLYTADPTARVIDDTLYVFPSGDTICVDGKGSNGFCMQGYNVFSSVDLMNFTDHGRKIHHNNVPWVEKDSYGMWAPDCIEKDEKYYYYFPAMPKDESGFRRVGVAIADHPAGNYVAEENYISTINGIDPNVFVDDDKQAYIYWGAGEVMQGVKLNSDMKTTSGSVTNISVTGAPEGYKEGTFVFKRNGVYYYTFPHAVSGSEEIAYATGSSPLGPFTYKGVIMDRWTDCWTNHHSILEYKDQWYIFYHHNDLSGNAQLRSMCADKLFFNEDGTIKHITATKRGIGIRKADEKIQIDRFSEAPEISTYSHSRYLPGGFYISNVSNGKWLRYDDVDFGDLSYNSISARIACGTGGGTIELRKGDIKGEILGTIDVENTGGSSKWKVVQGTLNLSAKGLQNLVLVFKSDLTSSKLFDVDWVRFDTPGTFQLNLEGDGSGEVVLNSEVYIHSETSYLLDYKNATNYSLEVKPKEGSSFDGWLVNGEMAEQVEFINEGDIITAIFSKEFNEIDGLKKLEAEDYTTQSGILVENCSEGGQNIGYIKNGDYIVFKKVNFGEGVNSLMARVTAQSSGGKLIFCLDDLQASPIATIEINSTGGWQNWETITTSFEKLSGIHDVYFKFEGGGGYLFNVNWLQFQFNELTALNSFDQASIKVFPNPANEFVSVKIPEEYLPTELTVCDVHGKKVKTIVIESTLALNLSFEKGLYVFTFIGNDYQFSEKVSVG